ncbi:MAG: TAXI family TRAP transporter solute-binding subunit [Rhodospirillales bacterium]|nr:MAG: TAXI family TRAP transporter solute-binding subunit [Rhodospirillales bacterium]
MIKTLFAAAILAATYAGGAAAQVVGVASGQPGSLGHNTGQAVAKILNQEAGITARTQPLAGTTAYVPLINRGEMEFGFANAVEVGYAVGGTGNWEGRPNPNLRMVGMMFPLRTGLMAPADLGIKTIADLRAKAGELRIASEYTADTIIRYYIMGALANGGMSYDDFRKVPVSNFVKGIQALGDGLVDVSLVSLNSGAGKKANVQLAGRGGLQYVSMDDSAEGQKRFKEFLPAASIIPMKANPNIPGLIEPANIVEIPWMMFTHADAPEDLVYRITKAVAENNAKLGEAFGAFKRARVEKMAPKSAVEYHPGAVKYYREAGIAIGG